MFPTSPFTFVRWPDPADCPGPNRTYVWDAENRLIRVEPTVPNTVESNRRSRFAYDYRGRRIRSWTETWSGSAWSIVTSGPDPDKDIRYVWDDWLLLEELNGLAGNAVLRKYTWGLDLAGLNGDQSRDREGAGSGRTSAGGIGGLLAVEDVDPATPQTGGHWYAYDANGNVSQVVSAGGAIAAHYEYDPYGGRLNKPGDEEIDQPFQFSTKAYDSLAGMNYYGYRWYLPRLGRWVSRDPIGEIGDLVVRIRVIAFARTSQNLGALQASRPYAFVNSRPTSAVDPLGLETLVALECSWVWRYGIPVGAHCSVVATCAGEGFRWEDFGWANPDAGVDGDDPSNSHNDRKGESDVGGGFLDSPDRTSWTRYQSSCRKEACSCDLLHCFKQAIRAAQFVTYQPLGPNSNTFARALMEKCGCTVPMFPTPFREGFRPSAWDDGPGAARGWRETPPNYWRGWEWSCP